MALATAAYESSTVGQSSLMGVWAGLMTTFGNYRRPRGLKASRLIESISKLFLRFAQSPPLGPEASARAFAHHVFAEIATTAGTTWL